jgi:DNA repair protein RadC
MGDNEGVVCAGDVYRRMKRERMLLREHFVVFHLDTQNVVKKKEVIAIGTLNACLVHPREVFREAIAMSSASIIVSHNHPSGSLEPSDEDLQITRRLKSAGEIIGIQVLDHVIVAQEGYNSLAVNNLM